METTDELTISAPHRELLDQVLDKWSLAVLNELCERPCRFNDLRRAIPAVTQKSLTATLRSAGLRKLPLPRLQRRPLRMSSSQRRFGLEAPPMRIWRHQPKGRYHNSQTEAHMQHTDCSRLVLEGNRVRV